MNTKKLSVILIAVAFTLVTLFSCMALFSVKKVEIEFAVGDSTDLTEVEEKLDAYLGKNLLFLKTSAVEDALKDFQYMQILSIEKQYPNVLKLKIEQRRETYFIECGDKVYVTTAEGFVLNVIDSTEYLGNTDREKITLKVKEISISQGEITETDAKIKDGEIGKVLSLSGDDFLSTVFYLAQKVNLANCIKELKVEKIMSGNVVGARDILITTYTGVKIRIIDADVNGEEKIVQAFNEYDNAPTDYIKTFNYILVSEVDDNVVVEWSAKDNTPL